MLSSDVDIINAGTDSGTVLLNTGTDFGNVNVNVGIVSGTNVMHTSVDSNNGHPNAGTDGVTLKSQYNLVQENSTVHVTASAAPNVSSVRVSISLEYSTSTRTMQSDVHTSASDALSNQQFIIPQRNDRYSSYPPQKGSFAGPSFSLRGFQHKIFHNGISIFLLWLTHNELNLKISLWPGMISVSIRQLIHITNRITWYLVKTFWLIILILLLHMAKTISTLIYHHIRLILI